MGNGKMAPIAAGKGKRGVQKKYEQWPILESVINIEANDGGYISIFTIYGEQKVLTNRIYQFYMLTD